MNLDDLDNLPIHGIDPWVWTSSPQWSRESPQAVPAERFYAQMKYTASLLTSWKVLSAYELMRRGKVAELDRMAMTDWDLYFNESHHWDRSTLWGAISQAVPVSTQAELSKFHGSVSGMMQRIETGWIDNHIRTLLTVVICQAWASFEVYVADLWGVGITQDRRFMTNFLLKERPSLASLSENASVSSRSLLDVVKSDSSIATFQRFSGIYDAYASAFGKDEQLKNMLHSRSNHRLYYLAQLRHSMMHCGGIVDQEFVDKMRGTTGDQVGDQVSLNIGIVCDLLTNSVCTALSLGEWVWKKYEKEWKPNPQGS